MTPGEKPLAPETRETLWRTLQTFSLTRIVIALVLLVYLFFNSTREHSLVELFFDWKTCFGYLLLAFAFAALAVSWRRRFLLQLLVQVGSDIGAISALYIGAGGVKSGLAILYLFPLAGCAIMVPLVPALFFVSLVAITLLGESLYQLLRGGPEALPSLAGLYGGAFFAAIYLINRLAAKLIKQEDLAAHRGRELQMQEAINRLVLVDMEDGILVVGPDTEVFAGNPAVERLLGLPVTNGKPGFRLNELPSLVPLADAFQAWVDRTDEQAPRADHSAFVMLKPRDDVLALHGAGSRAARRATTAHLKLRFANVEAPGLPRDRTVIFLEDVTQIENRAQQLKLASMGRLTASIAHEVRNPLSAIAHAASLLREEAADPTEVRLLNIVGDNVVRLNRMIEDILKLSRKAQGLGQPLQLASFLDEVVAEFQEAHAIAPGLITLGDMRQHQVRFDPLHLHEVVVNLLSNAMRYASGAAGSIRIVALFPETNRFELHVQDDGPAITPEVRAHLFEPFYTTSSKGTGLGLYVARELCLNNGAMLDYEYRMNEAEHNETQPSGRFVITFADFDPV